MKYGDRLLSLPDQAALATRVRARSSARVDREIDSSSLSKERDSYTANTSSTSQQRWSQAELAQRIATGPKLTFSQPTGEEWLAFCLEYAQLTGKFISSGPQSNLATVAMRVHGPNSITALRRLYELHGETNLLGWLRTTPPFVEEGPPLPDDPEPRQPAGSPHPFASDDFNDGWITPNEWSI